VTFPPALKASSDLEVLATCEATLVVVPSHGFRDVLRRFLAHVPTGSRSIIVSATKGIETDTLARMSEVTFEEAAAADRDIAFACLAGPSFAAELAVGVPTAAVVASEDGELAASLREALSSQTFRLYSTTDVVGVELGGTTKNVVAIAAGMVTGLGLGHNTLAALLTRGLHEITRLGIACGGRSRTLAGLAGMGDLVLSCTGGLSRNRRIGVELARGRSLEEILGSTSMVAEGVRNSLAVARIAERRGVQMPITEQMVEVLHRGKSPRDVVHDLMTRELKSESEL
jgi:glycerol-3-phosphate dehydrogenase (NAD(P)+)